MKRRHWKFGPGLLVAAAFIGPGTVTTASIAGSQYGYALGWAVLFSVLTTILLQEMAARLGLVTRSGLGEAVRRSFTVPAIRFTAVVLVVTAIGLGNIAYQGGNILGASIGLQAIAGGEARWWVLLVAIAGLALIMSSAYKLIERILMALVGLMALVFVLTAAAIVPDPVEFAKGLFVPVVPAGGMLTVLALVGTTVVPYNLFLHASAVREKWPDNIPTGEALTASRCDTAFAVGLGGLITLAIMLTAVPLFIRGMHVDNLAGIASQLSPLLGQYARPFIGLGLLAAGLTSAVTAPLAAGYAVCGVLGWGDDLRGTRFRLIAGIVLLIGTVYAFLGHKPVEAIVTAQAANGILLPLMAIFLLRAVNRPDIMGDYRNGWLMNLLGVLVVGVMLVIGGVQLLRLAGYGG